MKKVIYLLVFFGFVLPLGQALAEEESLDRVYMPAVTVTANKITEDVQDVPQSITVISGEEAEMAGITSVGQLASRVPNLVFATGGMSMINLPVLRGVQTNPHSNVPGVILYVDDVPVTANLGYVAQFYDIESIEVLRGPQGTLYGSNAEGGIIKITTRKPSDELRGRVGAQFGNRNQQQATASISGPLLEGKIYGAAAFQYNALDGRVKNDHNGDYVDDKKTYSGHGILRATPSEDLEITFTAGMTKYDEGTFSMYLPPEKRHIDANLSGVNRSALNDQSLVIKYDLSPAWTLTSVTTRREVDADYSVDYDFTPYPMFEMERTDAYQNISQEIRASYEEDRWSAVVGVAYDYSKRKTRYDYYNAGMKHYAKDESNSMALFGQVKIPLAERWALTLGVRGDYYTTDFNDYDTGYSDDDSWTSLSPKAAIEFSITEDHMVYLSAARGFKAAGYDGFQGASGYYKYDEEEVWSVELGSKNTLLDGMVQLNAALFYNKYNDIQLETYYMGAAPTPMPAITNSGNPEAYGAELELSIYPLEGLEIFASAGYTYMRQDDFSDALGNYKDNKVPYVPEWTYSAGFQYSHFAGGYIRGEMLGATKAYLNNDNTGYIPSHTLFNTRVGWEFENGLELYAYANNIFDKRYDYVNAFGGTYQVATEGRLIGGGFNYRF